MLRNKSVTNFRTIFSTFGRNSYSHNKKPAHYCQISINLSAAKFLRLYTFFSYVGNFVKKPRLFYMDFKGSCNCWVFNSVSIKNNKMFGGFEDNENLIHTLPHIRNDIEINEDDPPDPPRERIVLTWPGTKWCGPGNIAIDYHDLGYYNDTDKCCRAHDLCSDLIIAGGSAHGLQNDDFYTKLNCKCDEKFLLCLKNSMDDAGDKIGKLYFNAIGTQCFKNEHPIVQCVEYRGFIRKKCLKYELDTSKEKLYQWFDVPSF